MYIIINKKSIALLSYALLFILGHTVTAQSLQKIDVTGKNCFSITRYEITNQQYAVFLNKKEIGTSGLLKDKRLINAGDKELGVEFINGIWKPKPNKENYPMVMVSYYGAVEYGKWIGGKLPTIAQWQYAASGGNQSHNYAYAGSNTLSEVGWYNINSGQQSHTVGTKLPNELGLYDMSGNVWEWCLNESLKNDTDTCIHMGGSWYATENAANLNQKFGNTALHFSNSVGFRLVFPIPTVTEIGQYKGQPWSNEPQQIPGKIQCEWYDVGGEGVAYHDTDSINSGSGRLNPANGSFLNEFRINEAVDISYTKPRDIDNSIHNIVQPLMDQLYTGWTEPGEWINYTVNVNEAGNYSIGIMYTASGHGSIQLCLDGKPLTAELTIPSTKNSSETIDWRQWHHWNRIDELVKTFLPKGKHLLTIKTITNGNMNYDYLNFVLTK